MADQRMTKEEAKRVAAENPYFGDVGPINKLYNVLQGIGAELGGADMATPVGQRYNEAMAAGEAYRRRAEALHAAFPQEYENARMVAEDRLNPALLEQAIPVLRAMRPGVTTFSRLPGGPATQEQPLYGGELSYRLRGRMPSPEGPTINAGFDVPRGMSRFQANQYYMTHGIPGDEIYRRSNYGGELGFSPRGRMPSPPGEPIEMGAPYWPNAVPRGMNRFRANTFGMTYGRPGNEMYKYSNMDFVPTVTEGQETARAGQAVAPYRQGGLVYEPVGGPQGAAPRQIGGPQSGGLPTMAQGRGMRPTLIEGEFSEVPPQGQIPYGMGYRPNFTMEGGTYTPSMGAAEQFGAGTQRGYRGFGPLGAGLGVAAGPGVMYMADRTERPVSSLSNNPMQPSNIAPASPLYGTSPEGYPTFGIMPGAEGMNFINRARQGAGPEMPKGAGRRAAGGGAVGGGQKAVPLPPTRPEGLGDTGWEGNLNYLVTSLIDRISGQGEAERGRNTQEYYATNPWPY